MRGNDVYLTLENNLAPDEQPTVTIANGVIMDKAGNAYGGTRVGKAADGLGPNLSLSEDNDLSKTKVTITIATDEQLASLPDLTLGRVVEGGGVVNVGDQHCVYEAVDADPDASPSPLPALPEVIRDVTVGTGGAVSCETPADATPALNVRYNGGTAPDVSNVPGQPAGGDPNPSQTAALAYTYAATATTVVRHRCRSEGRQVQPVRDSRGHADQLAEH